MQTAQLDLWWITVAVFFDVFGYVAQGYRWKHLLRPVATASIWQTIRAIYVGLLLNEMVPLRPGEVIRGLLLSRETGCGISRILPSMFAERLMDGVWLVLAVVFSSPFIDLPANVQLITRALTFACVAMIIALLLLRRRIPRLWRDAIQDRQALVVSAGVLLCQGLAMWAVLRACHLPMSLFAGMVVNVVLRLGTLIPGAPANIGTHQFATAIALSLFGISQVVATTTAFIVFAVLTLPLWILGMLALTSTGFSLRSVIGAAWKPATAAPLGGIGELAP
jgi:hypothetical protein